MRATLGWTWTAVALVLVGTAGCGHASKSSSSAVRGAAATSPVVVDHAAAVPSDKARSAGAPVDRAVIRTADLTLKVRDVGAGADGAARIASAAGGEVFAEDRRGTGHNATADVELHVPTDSLAAVVNRLQMLGKLAARQTSSDDVTAHVADVNSRVASMRSAIARLRSLYNRSGSISQILSVESALSPREADLEALEAEQRALASQTATATINLHLSTFAAPTPTKHHASGFLSGLQNGWDAFAASVRWLLTALGAVLPFLAVFAAIGGALVIVRHRRAGRPPVAPAEPD